MKKVIYKFLDEYVGGGVVSKLISDRPNMKKSYGVYSNGGRLIFIFVVSRDFEYFKFFSSNNLCNTVNNFFGIDDANHYIRNWFADRNGVEKVEDIKRFIPS